MTKQTDFLRLVVEPVANGYLVEIEGFDSDSKHVFTSARLAMRFIKEQFKLKVGDAE